MAKKFLPVSLRSETGIVLISVLIIISTLMALSLHWLNQSLLMRKIATSWAQVMQQFQSEEKILCTLEQALAQSKRTVFTKTPKDYIFVPDHLEYECQEGVYIFTLQTESLQSHYFKR